jgi:hypothetical protein
VQDGTECKRWIHIGYGLTSIAPTMLPIRTLPLLVRTIAAALFISAPILPESALPHFKGVRLRQGLLLVEVLTSQNTATDRPVRSCRGVWRPVEVCHPDD